MTVTVDDLARHLGFPTTPADTEMLDRALGTARAVIAPYLIVDEVSTDQEHALDLAVLTVAQDLWRRKDSFGGSFLFADGTDLTGVLPREQLNSVWPLLAESGLVNVAVVA